MNAFKNILLKLFLIFTILSMLIISGIGGVYSHYKKMDELKTWIKSSGIIISSSINKESRQKTITYCPNIIVRYTFLEQNFNSKLKLEDGECRPLKKLASNNIKQYPTGIIINILINPKQPTITYIESYSGGLLFYLMLFLSMLSFIALLYILFTPSNKLNKNNP